MPVNTQDRANVFGVYQERDGPGINIARARVLAFDMPLKREEALSLAAWLLAVADPEEAAVIAQGETRFQQILQEILAK